MRNQLLVNNDIKSTHVEAATWGLLGNLPGAYWHSSGTLLLTGHCPIALCFVVHFLLHNSECLLARPFTSATLPIAGGLCLAADWLLLYTL